MRQTEKIILKSRTVWLLKIVAIAFNGEYQIERKLFYLFYMPKFNYRIMKKNVLLILFFSFLISCHKDNNNNGNGNGIVIKGTIPADSPAKRDMLAGQNSFSLTDAKKVLVYYGETYIVSEITNGTFSTNAPMNTATALIFLDVNNKYIGNIYVSGLNMLPLVNLVNSDQTVIDLSTLTLSGTSVIPSNNPIGSSILITNQDVALLKDLDSYYEYLSKKHRYR